MASHRYELRVSGVVLLVVDSCTWSNFTHYGNFMIIVFFNDDKTLIKIKAATIFAPILGRNLS